MGVELKPSRFAYETVKSHGRFKVLKRSDGKYTMIYEDKVRGQVMSAMPGDAPAGGDRFFAPNVPAGIDYVSKGYSRRYVNKMFRNLVRSMEEWRSRWER